MEEIFIFISFLFLYFLDCTNRNHIQIFPSTKLENLNFSALTVQNFCRLLLFQIKLVNLKNKIEKEWMNSKKKFK